MELCRCSEWLSSQELRPRSGELQGAVCFVKSFFDLTSAAGFEHLKNLSVVTQITLIIHGRGKKK